MPRAAAAGGGEARGESRVAEPTGMVSQSQIRSGTHILDFGTKKQKKRQGPRPRLGPSGFRTREFHEFHPFLGLNLNPRIWEFRFSSREFGPFGPLTLVFSVFLGYFPCYFGVGVDVELGLEFKKNCRKKQNNSNRGRNRNGRGGRRDGGLSGGRGGETHTFFTLHSPGNMGMGNQNKGKIAFGFGG